MEQLEDVLEMFPKRTNDQIYASFIYQPERVSINSRTSNLPGNSPFTYDTQNFSRFSNQLVSPILHAKSIELLRVTGSLPVPSIPNNQTVFFYYRIPIIGTGPNPYDPDYTKLIPANIKIVRLLSTVVYSPSRYLPATSDTYGFNGIFSDYDELVSALNRSATADPNAATLGTYYIPGDVSFSYDDTSKKIIFQGNNYQSGGLPQFYYIPVGFNDSNLATVQTALIALLGNRIFQFQSGYTLNKRLGFLWDGTGPFTAPNYGYAGNYTYPLPNYVSLPWSPIIRYFADSYADLLNTQNIFLYCDIVGGSTQDTNIKDNLLGVVPVNAGQLGVFTYQSSQHCKLTKISTNIYEITIVMKTDTGADFFIPINGFINIEFALTY